MKTLRKQYPKVRGYVKGDKTYYRVDLRHKNYTGLQKTFNFTDREQALKFAANRGELINGGGFNAVNVTSTEDTAKLKKWKERAAFYRLTIDQVFEMGFQVAETKIATIESPFMAELLTDWVDDKINNKLKPLRDRSIKSIRNMANIFKEDFGMARIKEINRERIETYLQSKNVSNQYRKNLCSYLGQFFNWAVQKGYHNQNPTEKIEIHVESAVPEFFTVEQSQAIMKEAIKDEKMTAYFALALFGGIRPEEVERLTWENINLKTGEIFIPATISKTKKNRLFKMSDCLYIWMNHCQNVKPLVPEANIKNLRVRISKSLGFPWVADGLRHTFATFHYAKHHNLEELRHIMGNSPGVIERFYKGVIAQAEIEKFWNITPENC